MHSLDNVKNVLLESLCNDKLVFEKQNLIYILVDIY